MQRERGATLLGQGWSRRAAAAELGVDISTISRWRRDEQFRQLEQRAREEALDAKPSVRATLEAALTATKPNGTADWAVRVQAARTLLGAPPEDSDVPQVVRERIYVDRLGNEREVAA
jgi:transcriptional regulator with XRE-family HTH domain